MDISGFSLEQLKALAYDIEKIIKSEQQNLQLVEREIQTKAREALAKQAAEREAGLTEQMEAKGKKVAELAAPREKEMAANHRKATP